MRYLGNPGRTENDFYESVRSFRGSGIVYHRDAGPEGPGAIYSGRNKECNTATDAISLRLIYVQSTT